MAYRPQFIYSKSVPANSSLFDDDLSPPQSLSFPEDRSTSSEKYSHYSLDSQTDLVTNLLRFSSNPKLEGCLCPHVLIADDDSFQHLYYQSLFQKSLDFSGLGISKEELKVHLCFSGEELLEKYRKVKDCDCKRILMIITDYQMGTTKLNGVQTSLRLRDATYKGHLVLRTGETKAYLEETHDDFEKMMEKKVIDTLIDKKDVKGGKDMIQDILHKMSKVRGKDSW